MSSPESGGGNDKMASLEAEVLKLREEVASLSQQLGRGRGSSSRSSKQFPINTPFLTELQLHLDERIRTLCLVICALAVLLAAAWRVMICDNM